MQLEERQVLREELLTISQGPLSPRCLTTTRAFYVVAYVESLAPGLRQGLTLTGLLPEAMSATNAGRQTQTFLAASNVLAPSGWTPNYVRPPLFRRVLSQHPAPPTPEKPALSTAEGSHAWLGSGTGAGDRSRDFIIQGGPLPRI
jgi:hypothetical protein